MSIFLMRRMLIALWPFMLWVCGCASPPGTIGGTRPHHVVILPGIGGNSPGLRAMCREISQSGDMDAEVWDWTRLEPSPTISGLPNITRHARNQRRAQRLADEIAAWQQKYPDHRITLVGHSGGAGLALMACARLPADVRINLERLVLLSAAVGPCYDLRDALTRSRRGVFCYYSKADRLILDLSTRVFGTMERRRTVAAGCVGFATCDPRVESLGWDARMIRDRNRGGHFGALRMPFFRRFIIPELASD